MQSKKTLKGFTLIELIVVVAIFGIIMGIALGLLEPAQKIYKSASEASDIQSVSDYLRRYVEDNIQYSDRMAVYTNMTLSDDNSEGSVQKQVEKFRKKYYFIPDNTDPSKPVERVYPYNGFKGNDEVYVLQITNPEPAVFTNKVSKDAVIGTITLRKFKGGTEDTAYKRVWASNTDYYNDFAFKINLQTLTEVPDGTGTKLDYATLDKTTVGGKVSPSNFVMKINMYKKVRVKGDLDNANLVDSKVNKTISFKLKNLCNSTGAISNEKITAFQTDAADPTVKNKINKDVRRFCWYDNTLVSDSVLTDPEKTTLTSGDSGDVCIIFTKTPFIEKVIATT